jgi:hypothetical protein
MWANKLVDRLRDQHRDRAREAFERGAWLAVHVSPRDRPFDFAPNRGPFYDDCCLQGFKVCLLLLQNNLDLETISVISTEGGVFTPEHMNKDGWETPYDHHEMAQRTCDMYGWLAENEPQVIAMCPWILANRRMGHHQPAWDGDEWYRPNNTLPVVESLKSAPLIERAQPPAPASAEPTPAGAPDVTSPGVEVLVEHLGLVQEGQLRLVGPRPALGSPLRLTGIGMQEARPPESQEIDLSEYEGQAVMVRGHKAGGWIYTAQIIDKGGPILTSLVRQIFG